MATPKAVQATPSGYLVDLGDGSPPRLWPEHIAVDAGLVGPTEGLYQDPAQTAGVDPYAAPQAPVDVAAAGMPAPQAPAPMAPAPQPAAPAPTLAPGASQRGSVHMGVSNEELVRRTDVNAPPPPLDLSQQHTDLEAQRDVVDQGFADQTTALGDRADALQRADEIRFGKFDENGNLLEAGGTQKQVAQRNADLEARKAFDAAAQEHVQAETNRINERIARVPQEDPSRIWKENNAFQNAAGLLAAGLGGMLAVSTGSGRNMGLEAIERAIDRDVQAQRTNIENEWKKIANDKDTLEQYRQWKARERQTMLEESIVRLETLALDTEAQASTFTSKARQAEKMGQAAALRVMQAEKQSEFIKATVEYAIAESQSAHKAWYDMESLSLEKRKTSAQIGLMNAQAAAANRSNQPDAKDGPIQVGFDQRTKKPIFMSPQMYAVHKTKVNDLVEEYRKSGNFLRAAQQLKSLYSALGPGFNSNLKGLGSEQRDQAIALRDALAYELAGVNDKGQKSNQDIENWKRNLGDPEQFHRRGGLPQLDQVIEQALQKKQGLANTYGFSDEPSGARAGEPQSFLDTSTDRRKAVPQVPTTGKDLKPQLQKTAITALTDSNPGARADSVMALLTLVDQAGDSEVENVLESALGNRELADDGTLAPRKGGMRGGILVARQNVKKSMAQAEKMARDAGDEPEAERIKIVGQLFDSYLIKREKELTPGAETPRKPRSESLMQYRRP